MLDAQVTDPCSVQAALLCGRISLLLAGAMHHPCQLLIILPGDQGMAHVTFSDVVSARQVDVDGGYIAERQRGHTCGMDAPHCFQLVLVSADRGG